ncbi:hypothetical protein Vadar_011686 [Vaccinium darrowii]|uniref:Uncharacterized protein n=1 Tax=Vaccinium darrowii TaxID=229202 RepID=A0ACB7YVN8_9ERIC|nr:hypothetical protein Vadar_011686 [Vaccinium darrowii]
MSNYTKLEFAALDISGRNYLSWILDIEIHLDAMEIGRTITNGNSASLKDRARAMIFIRHHLHEDLKSEYLTVKDPLVLWNNLKERFGHQKTVMLPRARYHWMHLRFEDYKSVSEYNSALFRIVSLMRLCGEKITEMDMLEKTYSTIHPRDMNLSQTYRQRSYEKYSDLISCLLVAEQNNELLMKNHESRPTGSIPFPEANGVSFHNQGGGRGRGRGHGRGRGRGRGSHNYQVRGGHIKKPIKKTDFPRKWNKWDRSDVSQRKGNDFQAKPVKNTEDSCYRCGVKGHWSRTCRTPKHLVDLFQASIKGKGKEVETNFLDQVNQTGPFEPFDFSSFDMSDLPAGPSGTKDDFFDDGDDYPDWSMHFD